MLNKLEKVGSNRVKDLPWIKFHGKDYQIGRWTYGIACWYRDTYGDIEPNTPAITAHVLSKLIPGLFEEYESDIDALEKAISSLSAADAQIIDQQVAYAISLSTDPNTAQQPKKKLADPLTPIKAWVLLIVMSSMLYLAGIGSAFLICSN